MGGALIGKRRAGAINQRPQMKACALLLLVAIAIGQEIAYDIVPEGENNADVMAWDDLPNARESTLPNETNDLPSETYDLVQADQAASKWTSGQPIPGVRANSALSKTQAENDLNTAKKTVQNIREKTWKASKAREVAAKTLKQQAQTGQGAPAQAPPTGRLNVAAAVHRNSANLHSIEKKLHMTKTRPVKGHKTSKSEKHAKRRAKRAKHRRKRRREKKRRKAKKKAKKKKAKKKKAKKKAAKKKKKAAKKKLKKQKKKLKKEKKKAKKKVAKVQKKLAKKVRKQEKKAIKKTKKDLKEKCTKEKAAKANMKKAPAPV